MKSKSPKKVLNKKNNTVDKVLNKLEKSVLPHFKKVTKNKINMEPIYTKLFKVEFENSKLTKTELKELTDSLVCVQYMISNIYDGSANYNSLYFNMNVKKIKNKFKVIPLDTLLKIKKSNSLTKITINMLTKSNEIYASKVINDCTIDFNENILFYHLNYEDHDSILEYFEVNVYPNYKNNVEIKKDKSELIKS